MKSFGDTVHWNSFANAVYWVGSYIIWIYMTLLLSFTCILVWNVSLWRQNVRLKTVDNELSAKSTIMFPENYWAYSSHLYPYKFIFQIFYEHLVATVSRKTSSPTPSLLFTMSNCQPSYARTLYCTISHSLTKYFKINTKHEKCTTIKCYNTG